MILFSKPAEITAEYKIVTPLFLGGASQEADKDVFRTASFKGALRFWWRALNWAAKLRDNGNNPEKALTALHNDEGRLFGTASDGDNSRQSRFQLSTVIKDSKLVEKGGKSEISYLLGMGLYSYSSGMQRDYLSGGTVSVKIRFKPNTAPSDIDSVRNALIALGFFGGLGSRARKGFGSLAIQSISDENGSAKTFNALSDIEDFISTLDFSAPADAPLSAISSATRIDASVFGKNSLTLLKQISDEQQLYRSYGKDGKVNGKDARRNFIEDHDNVYAAINSNKPLTQLPKRSVFGLPHNYHFSSGGDMEVAPDKKGRRASPLLIHIHQFPNGDCVALQTLLQSLFLPKGIAVKAENPKNRRNAQHIEKRDVDYHVIHRYLGGFAKIDNKFKVLRNGQ